MAIEFRNCWSPTPNGGGAGSTTTTRHAGAWLVLAKKGFTQPTSLTYDQALEEAACFGWIDGQLSRRDEATYRQRFTPRRPRSAWSANNVALAERLVQKVACTLRASPP